MTRSLHASILILAILATAASADSSQAAESAEAHPIPELAQWEENLRKAGASAGEVKDFAARMQRESTFWRDYLRNAPQSFFDHYLKRARLVAREYARQQVPPAVFPGAAPVRSCESLRELSFENTSIETASIDVTDQSCRVTASVRHPPANDRVQVFVALPMKGWNGRFQGTGGGGFYGGGPESLRGPVAKGYAAGATNTGHEGATGSFALDADGRLNWQNVRNFAYQGIHDMTLLGKALVRAFYGKGPKHSYFVGGSTGGLQGLTEAQRFPEDYDGILSACPAIHWDRMVPAIFWAQDVMLQSKNFVSQAKLDAATAGAVSGCDAADGVVDGVIGHPDRCTYDPGPLVGSQIEESTFTEADAQVVRKIWEGPRSQQGEFLWYGMPRGTNLFGVARTEGTPLRGRPLIISLEWLQYFLLHDPRWDWTTLSPGEFELLFKQSIDQYRAVMGADNPDLTAFRDHGGKLIVYHGLGDHLIPAQGSIDYYERVQKMMGGPQRTAQFARLFLAPGIDHHFLGAGPTPTGMMNALVRWVEEGQAPEQLLAELVDKDGKVLRTRPLFPYPQVAKYSGKGSTDVADSFHGVTP